MAKTVKEMLDQANADVPRITPGEAMDLMAMDSTLVIDVRDAPEVRNTGIIPGTINVSRGMIEFRADPDSPHHDGHFSKDKTIIVYCASGGRSALAGRALKQLGYRRVFNLGGIKDWSESGAPLDHVA